MRITHLSRLLAALILGLTPVAAHAQPLADKDLFTVKFASDGDMALASDIFPPTRKALLGNASVDPAMQITDKEITHLPTAMVFPKNHGKCQLGHVIGNAMDKHFERAAFATGGHMVYVCKPDSGTPFIDITYATTAATPSEELAAFAKATLYETMRPPARIDDVTCTTEQAPAFVMNCNLTARIDGSRMQHRGRFIVSGTGFIALTWACLDARCPAAGGVIDGLTKTIVRNVPPVAP